MAGASLFTALGSFGLMAMLPALAQAGARRQAVPQGDLTDWTLADELSSLTGPAAMGGRLLRGGHLIGAMVLDEKHRPIGPIQDILLPRADSQAATQPPLQAIALIMPTGTQADRAALRVPCKELRIESDGLVILPDAIREKFLLARLR